MKKKLHALFFLLVALLVVSASFVGCSNEKSTENNGANELVEQQSDTKGIDASLEGMELLATIQYNPPKNMVTETEMVGAGFSSNATTYYNGENSRIETLTSDMGKQITIYNAQKGETYQYTEGEKTGILMADGEDSEDMEGADVPSFKDLVDESSENVVARVEKLDGEDVIYIETTQSEEGMGDVIVQMWYSAKYCIPLKYEMIMNGQVMTSFVVKNVKTDVKMQDDLFIPPSDIEFMNYDVDVLGLME
ncbi:hypothetical protein [Anaerovorax sp. IOR16]|uniref:hypothetical protein n=1 Tax=Anaerovorax sp. IOR16 TaxID=2773458 RepID=UPI0019D2E710|nr:hypothetical protein [Anaerovorax sp. IOR16]